MTLTRRLALSTVLLGLVTLAAPALAEPLKKQEYESRYLSDKFYFEVGWFGADLSTDISFGVGNILGTYIRLEDDLDLESALDTGLFYASWRFNRKHAVAFKATRLDRSGENEITGTIEISDPDDPENILRFEGGIQVESQFDNSIYGLEYRYSFYNNGKIDAGLSLGLGIYDFGLGLAGEASVIDEDGNEVAGVERRTFTEDIVAPIPTLGIHLSYAFYPKWVFRFTTDALDLSVGDYEGRIAQTKTTVQWFFIRHLSVGAGITTNTIDVRDTGKNPWRVNYRYGGFMLFFGAGF